jgi:hypothetical protein
MKDENINHWPAINLKEWRETPVIYGKVATESDAKKGLAIFCLKNAGENHKAYDIDLPKLAYLNNEENDIQELVVVIQVESTENGEIVGYRNPNGGNGACFLYELTFLEEEEIESIENK